MNLPTIPAPPHPPTDLTAAQRRGLRYQRRVGKWLRTSACAGAWDIHEGPWLQGPYGPVQPDFVLTPALAPAAAGNGHLVMVVLETKLTQCDCTQQLRNYKWALRGIAACAAIPVVAVQVCRRVLTTPTVRDLPPAADGHMLLWV